MIKNAASVFLFMAALMLLFLAGCAPKQPAVPEEQVIREGISRTPQTETLDATALIDSKTISLPPSKLKVKSTSSESSGNEEEEGSNAGIVEVPGFRVQIFVTNEEFDARQVEEEAMMKFDESVYLSFDSPNYKIRIGDCKTRTEANDLRNVAIRAGYKGAWVVQCKILTTKQ